MVTIGVGGRDPVDQLLWVNSVAGTEGRLKGPVKSKAGKVDSGFFGGLEWQA